MLQDEIASITKFCYDQYPVQVYIDRIPQDMVIPCLYFPAPFVSSSGGSLGFYRNSYQLFAKVYGVKTQEAHSHAHKIAEAILKKRGIIPIIDIDGDLTGKKMLLDINIQTKPVGEGVAQVTIKWEGRYPYGRKELPMMETLAIIEMVKPWLIKKE